MHAVICYWCVTVCDCWQNGIFTCFFLLLLLNERKIMAKPTSYIQQFIVLGQWTWCLFDSLFSLLFRACTTTATAGAAQFNSVQHIRRRKEGKFNKLFANALIIIHSWKRRVAHPYNRCQRRLAAQSNWCCCCCRCCYCCYWTTHSYCTYFIKLAYSYYTRLHPRPKCK